MSFLPSIRPPAVLSLVFYLCTLPPVLGQQSFQLKFRPDPENMIVVPVTINGAGPFNFLLDTGTTNTLIDRKLAEELHLRYVGRMLLATPSGEEVTAVAHAESLSLAGNIIRDLNVIVVKDNPAQIALKLRGTLGEDFLRNFDLLIDNRHHVLQAEAGPGLLMDRLIGERLPFIPSDVDEPNNQLVVLGHFQGRSNLKLVIDSGTPKVVLLSESSRQVVSSKSSPQPLVDVLGGRFALDVQSEKTLELGNKRYSNVPMVVLTGKKPRMDIDGLLPTSIFKTIFISHSGKFIILDPATRPELVPSKLRSSPDMEISDGRSLLSLSPPRR